MPANFAALTAVNFGRGRREKAHCVSVAWANSTQGKASER